MGRIIAEIVSEVVAQVVATFLWRGAIWVFKGIYRLIWYACQGVVLGIQTLLGRKPADS